MDTITVEVVVHRILGVRKRNRVQRSLMIERELEELLPRNRRGETVLSDTVNLALAEYYIKKGILAEPGT